MSGVDETAKVEEKREPLLRVYSAALVSMIDRLEFQAIRLAEKVEPVCEREMEQALVPHGTGEDTLAESELARQFREWTARLTSIADRLAETADRVQL